MGKAFIHKRALFWALATALPCAGALGLQARPDEPVKEMVGAIEGEAISVQGPMTVRVVDGQTKTSLRSGADVRVKSGRATIDLVEGGKIAVCGPAHFSVLKAGGALTLALDTGIIHAHIDREPSLTVYTALLQAKPISIGGAAQETVVGLDNQGALTIRAISGAVRVEHQLSGQSVVVPQNSDVLLVNGQLTDLRPGAGRSACDLGALKNQEAPAEISVPATTEEIKQRHLPPADAKPNVPASNVAGTQVEAPIYQVYLPPMRYDASLKVQQPPDPALIVLIRRVRVRPTLIFQGRVEGDSLVAENRQGVSPVNPQQSRQDSVTPSQSKTPTSNPTVVNRVRTFIKRLWNSNS